MRTVKSFKCPHCKKVYQSLPTWANHVQKMHPNDIPSGYSPARYFYYLQTNKTSNNCIMCSKPTTWNEATGKYERFCHDPRCKEKYREIFKNRMFNRYGKIHLLDDPNKQREMLMSKKNSGYYTFKSDNVKVGYVGSYEKDFLMMLAVFLHFAGNDILGPSPHTYYYDYKNAADVEHEGRKFYIPDYFIPSLNLEIEIKQNTNTHPKLARIDHVKELAKDEAMKSNHTINYIKLVEKDYAPFFKLLLDLKNQVPDTTEDGEASIEISLEASSFGGSCGDDDWFIDHEASAIDTDMPFDLEELHIHDMVLEQDESVIGHVVDHAADYLINQYDIFCQPSMESCRELEDWVGPNAYQQIYKKYKSNVYDLVHKPSHPEYNKDLHYLLIVHGDRVVADAIVNVATHELEEIIVWNKKNHHHGYASKLMTIAINTYHIDRVKTEIGNSIALDMYSKFGFVETSRDSTLITLMLQDNAKPVLESADDSMYWDDQKNLEDWFKWSDYEVLHDLGDGLYDMVPRANSPEYVQERHAIVLIKDEKLIARMILTAGQKTIDRLMVWNPRDCRQGYGSKLMQYAIDTYHVNYTHAEKDAYGALKFYQKFGFRSYAEDVNFVYLTISEAPVTEEIECTTAQEGVFSAIANFFHLSPKEALSENWDQKLFGNLLGDRIRPVAYNPGPLHPNVEIDTKKNLITVYNINFRRLIDRMRETYGESRIDNIFEKTYRSSEISKYMKKKMSRSNMRITSLRTPIFFALELTIIFNELGKKYNDTVYRKIGATIYAKSWLRTADADVKATPELSTAPLSTILKPKYKLLPYQDEFIRLYPKLKASLHLNGYILAFDPGLGKTLTSAALAECLGAEKVYIVCPNTLVNNWYEELGMYFEDTRLAFRVNIDKPNLHVPEQTKYYIVNNEAIPNMYQYIDNTMKSVLIVDESQNFRNRSGQRVADLTILRDKMLPTDVLMMSGTPIKAVPNEIVPSLSLIDPLFTEQAAIIYDRCFKFDGTMGLNIVQNRFGKVMYRKLKIDVLSLPPKNTIKKAVKIDQPTRYYMDNIRTDVMENFDIFYNDLIKDDLGRRDKFIQYIKSYSNAPSAETTSYLKTVAVVTDRMSGDAEIHELDRNTLQQYIPTYVTPNLPNKQILKELLELEAKFIYAKNSAMGKAVGKIYPERRSSMFNAMFDENLDEIIGMIRSNVKKTLIFSQCLPVVHHICDVLNNNGVLTLKIVGGVKDRTEILKRFKEDEDVDVLVASSQTLGAGVTLVEASQVFFFGPPWRSTDFDQCAERVYRIGQTSEVNIYDFILDTEAYNLSNRMDRILTWSNRMFHGAVDPKIIIEDSAMEASVDNNEVNDNMSRAIKTLINLDKVLLKFDYGYKTKDGKETTNFEAIDFEYRTATPASFAQNRIGICWDFSMYQSHILDRGGYPSCHIFIQVTNSQDKTTHTFTVLPFKNEVLYIEAAYGKIAGVYSAPDLATIIDFIVTNIMDDTNMTCRPKVIVRQIVDSRKIHNLSTREYLHKIINLGNPISYEYGGQASLRVLYQPNQTELTKPVTDVNEVIKMLTKSGETEDSVVQEATSLNSANFRVTKSARPLTKLIHQYVMGDCHNIGFCPTVGTVEASFNPKDYELQVPADLINIINVDPLVKGGTIPKTEFLVDSLTTMQRNRDKIPATILPIVNNITISEDFIHCLPILSSDKARLFINTLSSYLSYYAKNVYHNTAFVLCGTTILLEWRGTLVGKPVFVSDLRIKNIIHSVFTNGPKTTFQEIHSHKLNKFVIQDKGSKYYKYIDIKREHLQLYHLSTRPLPNNTLFAKEIPTSSLANEDITIKRACFSPSVNDALRSIPHAHLHVGMMLTVYTPISSALNDEYCWVRPAGRIVPNAPGTNEIWSLKNVKCRIDGYVYLHAFSEKHGFLYTDIREDRLQQFLTEHQPANGAMYVAQEAYLTQTKTLMGLERVPFTAERAKQYKTSDNLLTEEKVDDTINGAMFIDTKTDTLKAYVGVNSKTTYIEAIWVDPEYRRKGLGIKLLNIASNSYNAQFLSVSKDNTVAIKAYKKDGWRAFKDDDQRWFMTKLSPTNMENVLKETPELLDV